MMILKTFKKFTNIKFHKINSFKMMIIQNVVNKIQISISLEVNKYKLIYIYKNKIK